MLSNVVFRRRRKLFASKGFELQDVIPHIILPIAKWNVFALNHPRKIWGRGASAQPMKIETCLTHGSWPKNKGVVGVVATGHGCRGFIMRYTLKKSYDNISLMMLNCDHKLNESQRHISPWFNKNCVCGVSGEFPWHCHSSTTRTVRVTLQ